MIFSAKNEKGEDLCDLVLAGRKTVTRRRTPKRVGAILAVQRGRGKKGIAKIKVVACELDEDWCMKLFDKHKKVVDGIEHFNSHSYSAELRKEAHREGFKKWDGGLWAWIRGHYGGKLPELYRIEFVLVKQK